jgi:hypothetical protein
VRRVRIAVWVAGLILVAGLALIMAHYVRYELIEPASVGAFCEAATHHWRCQIRQAIITLLTGQRLGYLAIVVAVVSLLFGRSALCWYAWFLSTTGFVLYHAEFAAPALLLSGVALTRARYRAQNERRGQQQPTARKG